MANKITRQASNEKEKMFLERFNSLCYTRSSWQVWSDFITAAAIAIANSTEQNPKIHEEREKEFSKCIERLGGQDIPAEMLGIITMALEENSEQDFLGNIFMKLELGSHWHGQFFTPYNICELMAEINSDNLKQQIEDEQASKWGVDERLQKDLQELERNIDNYVSLDSANTPEL